MTTEEKPNQNLTKCEACGKDISILADKCLGCGAPNNWIHPNIKQFLSLKDQAGVSKRFIFHQSKTEIWGETEEKGWPWWVWLSVIFSFLFLLGLGGAYHSWLLGRSLLRGRSFDGIVEATIILIVGGYPTIKVARMFNRTKEFKANLQTGTWWSNDDDFWQPLRNILKL